MAPVVAPLTTLGLGLIIGLVLGAVAVLLQQPRLELPTNQDLANRWLLPPPLNYTIPPFLVAPSCLIFGMLRNSLQIAARRVPLLSAGGGGVWTGYYKSVCFPAATTVTTIPTASLTKAYSSSSSTATLPLASTSLLSLSPTRPTPPTKLSSSPFHSSSATLSSTTSTSTSTSTSTTPSSPTSTMASKKSFLDAVKDRRTIYALNKEAPISDKEIVDIVKQAVLHVPSSFNSQSARLVVLLKAEHDKFWDATLELLKAMIPAEQVPSTEGRINGFKAAYGTILFFEDPEPVQALQKAFPLYAHHFPDWSEHTSAMHQFALWVALEAEGFGANLQHYNPVVDRKVQETWNVPLDWKLRAQLVFGGKAGEPGEKEFKPVEDVRLFVHGADL